MTCARLLMASCFATSMPAFRRVSISSSRAAGSMTTPLPITAWIPGRRMPLGINLRTNFFSPMNTVWPALCPPWYRATMENFSANRSTTFPLPSSPHCAPNTTTFCMCGPKTLQLYRETASPSNATLAFYAALGDFPRVGGRIVHQAPAQHLDRQAQDLPALRSHEGAPAQAELRAHT